MKIDQHSIQFHTEQLANLLTQKNHDYGNSVQEQFEEYGLDSILIRLDDKMRRLKTLRTKDPKVIAESLQDTLQDLSGYALLGYICLVPSPTIKGQTSVPSVPIMSWVKGEWMPAQEHLEQRALVRQIIGKPPYADIDDE